MNKKNKGKIPSMIPIIISLAIIAVLVFNIPISPVYRTHTTDLRQKFVWLGLATTAFVDDNPEFTSPILVEKDKVVELEPGNYYWKTEMLSPVSEFTIDSEVIIEVENIDSEVKRVKNVGNIEVLLEFLKNIALTGKAIINLNESFDINITNTTQIIASQYDNENE